MFWYYRSGTSFILLSNRILVWCMYMCVGMWMHQHARGCYLGMDRFKWCTEINTTNELKYQYNRTIFSVKNGKMYAVFLSGVG